MRKAPHDPPCEQWLMRLDVGAGSVGIHPVMKTKRKQHLMIPSMSSGLWGWMCVLALVLADPVMKTKRENTSWPPHEQWLMRLDVGAGIGVDPVVKMKRENTSWPPHKQWLVRLDVGAWCWCWPCFGHRGCCLMSFVSWGRLQHGRGTYLSGCAHSSLSPVAGPLSTLYPPHKQRGLVAAVGDSSSLV